jgi:TetR/AcrR family tetracycline transcriptional repressor
MEPVETGRRRGLTRQLVVERALKIGTTEGLEAVSLRRLASELGVTPMALYRHVRDKQDLINAMTEVTLEGLDLTSGLTPSMSWTDKMRLALSNFKTQMEERPLSLPLSIAYSGDGPVGFWSATEGLLGILLEAGLERRQAVVLIRVITNLLSGYLVLISQAKPEVLEEVRDPRRMEILRKRFELAQLNLPREQFPHLVGSAKEMADVWMNDPNLWWNDTVDLIVFGLERFASRD